MKKLSSEKITFGTSIGYLHDVRKNGYDTNEAFINTVAPDQMALWDVGLGVKLTPEVLEQLNTMGCSYVFGDTTMLLRTENNEVLKIRIRQSENNRYLDFNTIKRYKKELKKVV